MRIDIPKGTKGYSYWRFSKPSQGQGHSEDRQLEGSREWVALNAPTLEMSEEYFDRGVSAFRGKNKMIGVLGLFLKHVEDGTIPSGSWLIIENIDRLSREKVLEALGLYTDLIKAGITIVTIIDDQVHSRGTIERNPMVLQMAIAQMSRANEESRVKSDRIGKRWRAHRKLALEGKAAPMGRLPTWLERNEQTRKVELIKWKAEAIKECFELAAEGLTPYNIALVMNKRGRKLLTHGSKRSKSGKWCQSSVRKLLDSKAVCGTLVVNEPYEEDGKRKLRKLGERRDYFPKAVSRELFAKVGNISRARKERTNGRRGGSKCSAQNAFSGWAKAADGGSVKLSFTYYQRKKGGKPYGEKIRSEYLQNVRGTEGTGDRSFSWHYGDFQNIFLATCRLALKSKAETTAEEEKLAKVEDELATLKEGIDSLLSLAKQAKNAAKGGLLAELENEYELKAEKEEEAESLRNAITAARQTSSSLPKGIEKDRVKLRNLLQANVESLLIDFEKKRFTARLFSGITYEAWLSENRELFVATNDFKIPKDAFKGLKLKGSYKIRKNPKRRSELAA